MHARASENFASRSESRRLNSRTPMSSMMMKNSNVKGPSPTSVITTSFSFDNEDPFDCKATKTSDKVERAEAPIKSEAQSCTDYNVPPLSPRNSKWNQTQELPPKSSNKESITITSTQKASTFRQRRIEIAQQRKWTEKMDVMRGDSNTSSPTRTIDIHGARFSTSVHERRSATYFEHDKSSSYSKMREDEICQDPEHVDISSSQDKDEESDDDMTIDTVSSLHTNWTSRSNDAFSARSWLPPKIHGSSGTPTQQKSRKFLQNKGKVNDSVHPPMFVSSKKNRKLPKDHIARKDTSEANECVHVSDDEFDPEVTFQRNNHAKDHKKTDLDVNSVVNHIDRPLFGEIGDENSPVYNNTVHREKPSPETFLEKGDLDYDNAPIFLRRKRLSRLLSENQGMDTEYFNGENSFKVESKDSSNEPVASPKSSKKLSIDVSRIQLFDESSVLHESATKSMSMETKLESDLIDVMDKRDADDERSLHSIKSCMTFATMKTCFTVKPTTPEEVEIAMNRKRNRIRLFHHVMSCEHPRPTSSDDDLYVPCPDVKHCHALSVLVRHVQTCTFINDTGGTTCDVPRCAAYKKVWNHYRRCASRTFSSDRKDCKVCSAFWKNRE